MKSFPQLVGGNTLSVVLDTSRSSSENQRGELVKALSIIKEGKTPAPKGVEAGLELFKALPADTKKAIEEQAPEDYRAFLPVLGKS